ncbi:nucleoside/nucleotide kinase family protein [uncultured Friedmanniella sp.]|uniref:nucleoside/nucleotide kinase family protein n=1 Tax=uncultured Friedmanniella sp. TaxID=335381 RepID=UPI0035CA4EA9
MATREDPSPPGTGTGGGQSLDQLVAAARRLIRPGERHFLGITGAPGAGKSTLAEALAAELAPDAALVGMDGFHLRNDELQRLGRLHRKGASDTFDVAGYVHLLHRLRDRTDEAVYAPVFDRSIEESIGSAVRVERDVPLIITEGNYLLVDHPGWKPVADLLDEAWYVEPGDDERLRRLIARHVRFGRPPEEAHQRSHGPDGDNARLVETSKRHATRVVHLPTVAVPGS